MLQVQSLKAGIVRVHIAAGADLEMLVVAAEIRAPHRGVIDAAALHDEGGIELHAQFVGAVADDAQGVVAAVDEVFGILGGATEDQVVPRVDIVSHEFPSAGVVQHGAAFAEAEGDSFYGRAREFVDQSDVFLFVHGRFVAVYVGMSAIVVIHYFGFAHFSNSAGIFSVAQGKSTWRSA